MTTEHLGDRLVLISADGHAGANHDRYRSYLEARYLDQFDDWRQRYSNPFKDLTGRMRNRNWDDERRLSELSVPYPGPARRGRPVAARADE